MKRNRKVKKHSRCTVNSVNFVALIVLSFFALMVYWSQDARCTALAQEIGKAEKTYKQLVKETERVAARWNELMAVDRLQEKLVRFGLEMNIPRADQVVRMNAAGRPLPGQIAVVRARERMATANMAQVAPAAQPRKGTTRRKIR